MFCNLDIFKLLEEVPGTMQRAGENSREINQVQQQQEEISLGRNIISFDVNKVADTVKGKIGETHDLEYDREIVWGNRIQALYLVVVKMISQASWLAYYQGNQ